MPQEPIRLSGEETFTHSREEIFSRVTDLEFMSKTIPGLQKVEFADAKTLRCRVKPGFAFLTGAMKMQFEILNAEPPQRADMRVTGQGIGSSVVVETAMQLVPDPAGSRLLWTSEVKEMTGLSKVVSRGLIEAAAKKINGDTWASFRRALEQA